jgi:hypothetical protein
MFVGVGIKRQNENHIHHHGPILLILDASEGHQVV